MPDTPRLHATPGCSAVSGPEGAVSAAGRPPHAEPAGPGLLQGLAPLLREWLPRQRWFAGKGREITGFGLISAVELRPAEDGADSPGLLHLLLDVGQAGGGADCYQLLLGTRPRLPDALSGALIGRVADGPLSGLVVYEALFDPELAGRLLERLRAPGQTGPLRFSTAPDAAIPAGLPPRPSGVEQSNSSVVYGEAFILKVFRRVSAGTNPDLEVSLALARTGCPRVPAPAAWFEALGLHDEPATLGVMQRFLPNATEGWALALRAVDEADGADRTDAAHDAAHDAGRGDGTGAATGYADFTGVARELGTATAEVHGALARALPHEALSPPQVGLLATAMADRLAVAARAVPELAAYAPALRGAFTDLAELAESGATFDAQRIHGDLHLGQVLRTAGGGWVLIDFEGEPARPLSERRRPQLAVQDVAGMLRSFDYAARHRDPAAPRAAAWAERQRAAFCEGYARSAGRDPRDAPVPLRAYETDKAVYEVLYEARHRPAWLPIPMAAVRRLAAG